MCLLTPDSSRFGTQRRIGCLTGRGTGITSCRLLSLAAKASTVQSLSSSSYFCSHLMKSLEPQVHCALEDQPGILSWRLHSPATFIYLSSHQISEALISNSDIFRNRKDSLVRLWAEQDQGEYKLQKDGSLLVKTLPKSPFSALAGALLRYHAPLLVCNPLYTLPKPQCHNRLVETKSNSHKSTQLMFLDVLVIL